MANNVTIDAMKLEACGLSDVGRKRTHNEDSHLINPEAGLFLVADGMGGHSGGEFASKLAVTTIEQVLTGLESDPEATMISGVNTADAEYGDRLRYAIGVASSKIFDQAVYDSSLKGMGTTTVALLLKKGCYFIANVGDSRAYLLRDGNFSQLTEDHSLVSEQFKAGIISRDELKGHRLKNIITRSVGYQEEVEIDLASDESRSGDCFLLCTDGLTNMLSDYEIKEIFAGSPSLAEGADRLVTRANEVGGDDNITVVSVKIISL